LDVRPRRRLATDLNERAITDVTAQRSRPKYSVRKLKTPAGILQREAPETPSRAVGGGNPTTQI
jgi:hypothetical protein